MFRTLLVPLDQSRTAEQALIPATQIAQKLNAHLDIVHVHERASLANLRRGSWSVEQELSELRYVEHVAQRIATQVQLETSSAVLDGNIADAICTRATDIDADLIVMSSHGHTGLDRTRLGSIADEVMRKSDIPVLMIRRNNERPEANVRTTSGRALFQRILVPLDGSLRSLEILAAAVELARCNHATLILLRVVEPVPLLLEGVGVSAAAIASGVPPFLPSAMQDIDATRALCAAAQNELSNTARLLADEDLAPIESHVVVASYVAAAIVDFVVASGADLVAMSTHGRGASRWLMGSVTDKVMAAGGQSMLIARPVRQAKTVSSTTRFAESERALVGLGAQ